MPREVTDRVAFAIRSRRVALPGGVVPATVVVRGERIERIAGWDEDVAVEPVDVGERALLPGAVDVHVHVNEPGRTAWEGFRTATRAAAAGGTTTIVDMPLNAIPPTTTVAGLEAKRSAAEGTCRVDVAFWGGVVPDNGHHLEPLAQSGVRGFKAFLAPSGVPEFPPVGTTDLRAAMERLVALGLPLLVHAEDPAVLNGRPRPGGEAATLPAWLASRPAAAEVAAIRTLVGLCRETGARVHVVHLGAAEAIPLVEAARDEGLPFGAEACPHHLTFAAEEIEHRGALFKCAPPIRDRANRERLWEALGDGTIDLVASDHSPCPPAMKDGTFAGAWGGIASLELLLRAVWSEARSRGFGLADLARWTSAGPAALAGLEERKGAIAVGRDADLVVFDPEPADEVDPGSLHQRHPMTPYAGSALAGRVVTTYLRGAVTWDGEGFPGRSRGRTLGLAGAHRIGAS